jgi:hypothetical protein
LLGVDSDPDQKHPPELEFEVKSNCNRLGRSRWRAAILSLVRKRAISVLPYYASLARHKPGDESITYCSGAGGEPYTTMLTLLAYSIALREDRLPKLRIGYESEPPAHLERLGFVEFFPVRYSAEQWPAPRALKFWNFQGKPQALLGAETPLSVWLDSDVILVESIRSLFSGNAFVSLGDKVGGGLYCLKAEDKQAFYTEVFKAQREWQTRSDRPCMRRAIEVLKLDFQPLPLNGLKGSDTAGDPAPGATDSNLTRRYWMHLSRGKARNVLYTMAWVRQVRQLLYPRPALLRNPSSADLQVADRA